MAPDGVPCEFRGFLRKLAKPSNHDETAKQRITSSNHAIWRLSHGDSRPSMKNGESPACLRPPLSRLFGVAYPDFSPDLNRSIRNAWRLFFTVGARRSCGTLGAGRPTAARRAISLRNDRSGRGATCCGRAFPHFHASTRPIHQSIDPATKHGIFTTNDAKALKALRTLRPTLCELCGPHYLITGAMTLSEMTVLAMDEILLRTEISRMRKEGTRRGASERARRGYGRDKCGPPA